jgi:hypothetical protein
MKILPQLAWGRGTAREAGGGGAAAARGGNPPRPSTSLRLVPLPETSSGRN